MQVASWASWALDIYCGFLTENQKIEDLLSVYFSQYSVH